RQERYPGHDDAARPVQIDEPSEEGLGDPVEDQVRGRGQAHGGAAPAELVGEGRHENAEGEVHSAREEQGEEGDEHEAAASSHGGIKRESSLRVKALTAFTTGC